MNTRATDLKHALRLSGLSIVWSGVAGSIAVYAALVSAACHCSASVPTR